MRYLPIVNSRAYAAELPARHRFPMGKFQQLRQVLVDTGLVGPKGFLEPAAAPDTWVSLAHDQTYVDQVFELDVPDKLSREIGFPVTESVVLRARAATAGTVLTAQTALAEGLACNTAGGSHHARRTHGAGFCVFNDVAVAVRVLMADGDIQRSMIIDLDVHQGDGTADILASDPSVFTFSMHAARNFPVRKVASDLDIGLDDETGDAAYLGTLAEHLSPLIRAHRPDIVFYNAGVDVHAEDRLGRLALSDEGIALRDRHVIETCLDANVPVACVIGGGYMTNVERLAQRHSILHRVATDLFQDL